MAKNAVLESDRITTPIPTIIFNQPIRLMLSPLFFMESSVSAIKIIAT